LRREGGRGDKKFRDLVQGENRWGVMGEKKGLKHSQEITSGPQKKCTLQGNEKERQEKGTREKEKTCSVTTKDETTG